MSQPEALNDRLARLSGVVDEQLVALLAARGEAVANLNEGMLYALGLDLPDVADRGKRIRPALCLLVAEDLGAPREAALPFALGIELMHNFALVHDDIEDGDTVRRNRPAVWRQFGLPHGVNIGDYLLVHVYRALLLPAPGLTDAARLRLMGLMTEALDHTHIGQALDMNARTDRAFAMPAYERIVREKTGHYLAAPMLGGAVVGGAGTEILAAIERFGLAVGPMFQILDDLIDLTQGKGRGGETGNDIREGKRSFMVAWTAARASAAERERLFDILDLERDATTAAHVAEAAALFERHGALAAARDRVDALHHDALAALAALPEPLATTLRQVNDYLRQRQK